MFSDENEPRPGPSGLTRADLLRAATTNGGSSNNGLFNSGVADIAQPGPSGLTRADILRAQASINAFSNEGSSRSVVLQTETSATSQRDTVNDEAAYSDDEIFKWSPTEQFSECSSQDDTSPLESPETDLTPSEPDGSVKTGITNISRGR